MKILTITVLSLLAGTVLANDTDYFVGVDYVYQDICPAPVKQKLKKQFHGGNFYMGTTLNENVEIEVGLHMTPWHQGQDIKHRATAPFIHVHYLHPITDKLKLVGGVGGSIISFDYHTLTDKQTTRHGAAKLMFGGRYTILENVSLKFVASIQGLESSSHHMHKPKNIQTLYAGVMYHF